MKILFDQNLSRNLVPALRDIFPDSKHVLAVGLDRADDPKIWAWAKENGFWIASKDDDFLRLALQHGAPPKVIFLNLQNCPTKLVEDCLRRDLPLIAKLDEPDSTVVALQIDK